MEAQKPKIALYVQRSFGEETNCYLILSKRIGSR